MRHALARAAAIVLALGGALAPAALRAGPVDLEHTFYHDGNMNGSPWSPPAIDVAADGTVAVAINRTVGPSNVPQNAWYVLLYDTSGEPTAEIAGTNTTMIDVAFGPDGRSPPPGVGWVLRTHAETRVRQ
ncbi:MAG: hypothetical protein IMZ65_01845 [Planctomycetes bacterium]|nr:hypothetical protein [Planctomycetota bacterium]